MLNNPFFTQIFDKLSELLVYDKLSIPHARTVLLPRVNRTEDVKEIVMQPDWGALEMQVGFPCILKPVDGYAWQDVFKVETPAALRGLYESFKDTRTLIVQEFVKYESYYRAFCLGTKDVYIVEWTPKPFDMGEYALPGPDAQDGLRETIAEKTSLTFKIPVILSICSWYTGIRENPVSLKIRIASSNVAVSSIRMTSTRGVMISRVVVSPNSSTE